MARRDSAILRLARADDMPRLVEVTVAAWRPIFAEYFAMVGEECYYATNGDPGGTWEERKGSQIRRAFAEHPEWMWVLENDGQIIGFITFTLSPRQNMGEIGNNAVDPNNTGKGWATWMYRQVLDHFREQGLRFALVRTGLDPAHAPARRAYEAVGFNRQVPQATYWQDLMLNQNNITPQPAE